MGWNRYGRLKNHPDYIFEDIPGPIVLGMRWEPFLLDPVVLGQFSLSEWRRITVKTKGPHPQELLELAVYPDQRLVVFMLHPMTSYYISK